MTSQDPMTSKSHTFQHHHGDVRSRLSETRLSAALADPRFPFLGFFRTVPRHFPVSLFLSFFLFFFLIFWDSEVSVSFSCLTSLFICARARAFLFCSGWLQRFPSPFSLLSICHPLTEKNTQAWRVLTAGWFLRHMYSLTKWKCDSDAVMSEYKRPTVASLFSRWLRCCMLEGSKPTAPSRSRDVGGREAGIHAHEWKQQEAPLPHCRFEKSRQASPSLWTDKAKSPCACRFASTSNDHSISNGETELETFQGDTHIANRKIKRQNIRLNSCSFTLKERSNSDDMPVRQKSSKKQRKSLAGDAGMLTFCEVRDRGVCRPRPRAWTCYGTPWQQHGRFKDLYSPRGAKKKVFLGTSSTVTLLEKNHARIVGQFWNLAGVLLDYRRIIQT